MCFSYFVASPVINFGYCHVNSALVDAVKTLRYFVRPVNTMDFLKSLSGLSGNASKNAEVQSREKTAASVLFDWEVLIFQSFLLFLQTVPLYEPNIDACFPCKTG
jgi:hypothetical protein